MERNIKWCVYSHTNKINKKKYIGISSNVKERWGKSGKAYYKQVFGRAVKKYGWDNFDHEILFNNLTKEEACKKECELILLYKTREREYGYNRSDGGDCGSKGAYDIQFAKMRKVYRYDLDGNFIEEHISISSAARKISGEGKIKISNISQCCSGLRNMAHGYMWSYEYCGEKIEKYIHPTEITSKNKSKKIFQYSIDGKFLKEYESRTEAARENNTNQSAIGTACCRKGSSHGFLWRDSYEGENIELPKPRKDNSIMVYKYSIDMSLITVFKNITEVQKIEGISYFTLNKYIKNKLPLNNYIYSYSLESI